MTPTPQPADSYINTPQVLALIRRVFAGLLILTLAVTAIGLVIGTLIAGWSGVWAALIAAVLGLFFTGTTIGGLYLVAGRGMHLLMAVLLGGWIIKMVILGAVVFWLRGEDFYDRGTFAGTILAIVIGALVVEIVLVATARIPYVAPGSTDGPVNSITSPGPTGASGPGASSAQRRESAESRSPSEPGTEGSSEGREE